MQIKNELIIKIIGAIITILLSVIAWLAILTYYNTKDNIDSKLDAIVFFQYMALAEERIKTQKDLNVANIEQHKEILNKLDEINGKIHKLELEHLQTWDFRGENNSRWFYEELICFAWERDLTFNKLY